MPEKQQDLWFITGASSGLGLDFVRTAAARGDMVIASARNIEPLRELESDKIRALQLDLTACPVKLAERAYQLFDRSPNVLVSNAAYGLFGSVEEVTDTELKHQFQVNFFGLLDVQRALLPGIRSYGDRGWIFSVSGAGAWVSSAYAYALQASKHALAAMNRSLAAELASIGTHVIALEPGLMRTAFFTPNSETQKPASFVTTSHHLGVEPYETGMAKMVQYINQQIAGREQGDPVKVAQLVVDLVKGSHSDRKTPLELPLGAETFELFEKTFDAKLEEMKEWRALGSATDFSK